MPYIKYEEKERGGKFLAKIYKHIHKARKICKTIRGRVSARTGHKTINSTVNLIFPWFIPVVLPQS